MPILDSIRKVTPSGKFMTVSIILFPVYYALNVIAFDFLNLPAYIYYIVISAGMWILRYNIYKYWVYRK